MSDFLNERPGNRGDEDDFFAGSRTPTPQPAQATQPPAQPQGQRFIPEGYEPPATLNDRIARRNRDAANLNARLSRAGDEDPTKNPYAKKQTDGKFGFNQYAYDTDKRAYDAALADVNRLTMQLQSSMGVTERLSQSLEGIARQLWNENEARVPAQMKDAVRKRYAENVRYLMDNGHFQRGGFETREALQAAFSQVLTGIVGQFALDAAANQAKPNGQASGGREEKPDEDDEFAGWEPEAIEMFKRGMASGTRRGETLADRHKREAEEAQARLAAQGRGEDR